MARYKLGDVHARSAKSAIAKDKKQRKDGCVKKEEEKGIDGKEAYVDPCHGIGPVVLGDPKALAKIQTLQTTEAQNWPVVRDANMRERRKA